MSALPIPGGRRTSIRAAKLRPRRVPVLESLEPRALLASLTVGPVVNTSQAANNQAQPAIAINPTNPQDLVLFADEVAPSSPGLMRSLSTDGGKTWTSSVVATGSDGLLAAGGQASVAFDSFGNMFLTYLDSTGSQAAVVISTDGGKTLKAAATLSGVTDRPQLAVGSGGSTAAGSLWVGYRDTSGGISITGAPVTGPGQLGAFITPEAVDSSGGGDFASVAVGPKGQVAVAFEDPVDSVGPSNLFAANDPDGLGPQPLSATTMVAGVNVGGSYTVPAQPVHTFSTDVGLAYDTSGQSHNGRLYLVKTDAFNPGDQPTAIFVEFSDDDGLTWSQDVFVDDPNTSATEFMPRVAVDPTNGVVGVSWLDTRNDPGSGAGDTDGKANTDTELFATISLDGGGTFLPGVQVSAGPSNAIAAGGNTDDHQFDYGGYTGLAFFNNTMFPAWADNSTALTGNPDSPNLDIATAALTVVGGPAPTTNLKVTAVAPSAIEGQPISARVATFQDLGTPKPASAYIATINWGDGSAPTLGTIAADPQGGFDVNAAHTYLEEGSFSLAITVTATGAPGTASASVTVADASLSASPGAALNLTEGASVAGVILAHFNDADPGGTASDYTATIDWGDGSPTTTGTVVADPQGGFDVKGSHTYSEGGADTINITIHDAGGASTTSQVSAKVADLPLSATAPAGLALVEGATTSQVLATFTDANTQATLDEYTATIRWGDGTSSSGSVVPDPKGGFDVLGSHAFDETSTNTSISVHIADRGGSTADVTVPVTVSDAPLTPGPMAVKATEGIGLGTAPVATFSDANQQAPASDFTATIDWGDGTNSPATIVAQGNGLFRVLGSKTFLTPGTFPVTVTVHDVGGQQTTVQSSVEVSDAPLSAHGVSLDVVEGQPVSGVVATFTDANRFSAIGDFTATIHWSDGTTSPGVITADPQQGFVVSGNHVLGVGTSSIAVTINDVRGATAKTSSTAVVADAPLSSTGAVVVAVEQFAAVNLKVAALTDADPGSAASKLSAVIAWGDGSLSSGTIVPDGGSGGHFSVRGSHTYEESGVFPISVTVSDNGGAAATAASAAYVVDLQFPLTGRLDPASDTGVSASDGITSVVQPRFMGTAEPNSRVMLFAQRAGQPGTFLVGQAVAGSNGAWSTRIGPFTDGRYSVSAMAFDALGNPSSAFTPLMPAASGRPLVIETTGPHVVGASLNPRTGQVQVVFADDQGTLNPLLLANPASYVFAGGGSGALPVSGLLVSPPSAAATGLATVTFTVNGGRPLRAGRYVLIVPAGRPLDLAGNPLTERVFTASPAVGGLPPGSFVGQFDTDGRSLTFARPPGSPALPGASSAIALTRFSRRGR